MQRDSPTQELGKTIAENLEPDDGYRGVQGIDARPGYESLSRNTGVVYVEYGSENETRLFAYLENEAVNDPVELPVRERQRLREVFESDKYTGSVDFGLRDEHIEKIDDIQ